MKLNGKKLEMISPQNTHNQNASEKTHIKEDPREKEALKAFIRNTKRIKARKEIGETEK